MGKEAAKHFQENIKKDKSKESIEDSRKQMQHFWQKQTKIPNLQKMHYFEVNENNLKTFLTYGSNKIQNLKFKNYRS